MQDDELRRAHDELGASQARCVELYDRAPVGYVTLTESGTIREANLTAASLLGVARYVLVAQPFTGFVLSADRDIYNRHRQALFDSGTPQVCELRMVRGDDTSFWARIEGTTATGPGGAPECRAVLSDVTGLVEAAAALRRREAELQAIYEHAPTMMVVLDASLRVVYANRAFAEFLGRPTEALTHERACGVIGCLRALDDARGCGYGLRCDECAVRLAMIDTLATGQSHRDLDYRTVALFHGAPRDSVFLASVARIGIGDQPHLLLCLDDITAREHAVDELRRSGEQMRALAARLQEVREEERTRVAREIHDVLAQDLTRLKIDLVWLHGRISTPADAAAAAILAPRVLDMSRMVDATIHHVQRIATELRPPVLDSLGLCAAVEWHVRAVQDHSGLVCQADVPEEELTVAKDVATAAFRILQESLTNVLRHANATRVDVRLRRESDYLVLVIHDDGCGIRADTVTSPLAIGLAGMRERALLQGGHFEILSGQGSGTTIEVRLPLSTGQPPPQGDA